MLIDWFTVVAQIVNFLVLVALMKHFLYGRLLRAIDEREAGIAARLAEADQKNHTAEEQMRKVSDQIREAEQFRIRTISDVQKEAEEEHKQLVLKARESVRALEARWREDLDREKAAFLDELRRRAASEILSISRRALADLACADVQQCAGQNFLEKLRSVDVEKLRTISAGELSIQSAAELSTETRRRIQEALESRLGTVLNVRFEQAPAMAWGLELRGNGQRMGWDPSTYLDSLEERLKATLDQKSEVVYPTPVG